MFGAQGQHDVFFSWVINTVKVVILLPITTSDDHFSCAVCAGGFPDEGKGIFLFLHYQTGGGNVKNQSINCYLF